MGSADGSVHALPLRNKMSLDRVCRRTYEAWRVVDCPALDLDGLITGPRPGRLSGASVDDPGEVLCKLLDFCIAIGPPDSWDGVGLSDPIRVPAGGVRASGRAGDGGFLDARPWTGG